MPFDETLGFQMSDNAELLAVEVFDAQFETIYNFTSEDELRALNGELASGMYYVEVKGIYGQVYTGRG